MPLVPKFGPLPKNHKVLSSEEEKGERLQTDVEDENRDFYEANLRYAANVSRLQTGVNEEVARTLLGGPGAPGQLLDRLKEERVQSELYRAVQGGRTYETEPNVSGRLREDGQYYEGSENALYLNSNRAGKFGRQFMRVIRGAGTMIGVNSFVEAAVDRRFGRNRDIGARMAFVANQMVPELTTMEATRNAHFNQIATLLGVPVPCTVPDLVAAFSAPRRATHTTLWRIREYCRDPATLDDFRNDRAFRNMMLLVETSDRASNRIGIEAVNDFQGLREFHDEMVAGGGNRAALMQRITETLEDSALFPLEKNSEGKILLADLRSRYQFNIDNGDTPDNSANRILGELEEIRASELENAPQTVANTNTINEVNRIIGELRQNRQRLMSSFTNLNILATRIAGGLVGAPLTAAQTQQATAVGEHVNLEQNYQDLFRTLNATVLRIPGAPAFTGIETAFIAAAVTLPPTPAAVLLAPMPLPPPPFYDHLLASGGVFGTLLGRIPANYLSLLTSRIRVSSFVLLQRFLRRDYLRDHNLTDATLYSEEANKYAALKAGLRLEDVENIDIARSANNKAAEFLNKGLIRRAGDNLKRKVAGVQNFIGLEPFNIRTMTADSLVEQIVQSHADFHVFKGVNRFTSTRDLRAILNATGKKVPPEVVERFTQTLAEAVSQYKAVIPTLNGEVQAGNWDVENLIEVLKKFRKEQWINRYLERLDAEGAPDREQAFLRILREGRIEEKRISSEILKDVKDPDAMWRKFIFKDELKKVLDKETLDGTQKLKEAGIASREKEISRKEAEANALPDGDPKKQKLQVEIANQRASIATIRRQIEDSADLYQRVDDAKKYIAEKKLGRADKKAYLAQVGLTQVFDKMGTNFRLQRYWAATKKAAKWTGGKISDAWSWSREKFLNADTAKYLGVRALSITRLAATPLTTPLGWAWKAGTLPIRLTGRALLGVARVPSKIWRMMSISSKRIYLRDKKMILSEEYQDILDKQAKLQSRMAKAPYRWDKRRIMRQINNLEEDKIAINNQMHELAKYATKSKIPFDTIGFTPAAGDTAAKAPAAPSKPTPKKA